MTTILPQNKRWAVALLLFALAVSLACVIYPIYVIRPFRAQGESELMAALTVMRIRPVITVISALAALGAALMYWRAQSRRWWPALITATAALVCVLAVLARVNVYELMFHPVAKPSFSAASKVKLDNDEKVIAIEIGEQARAYPIRSISYHHIVNDVIDGRAVVATY